MVALSFSAFEIRMYGHRHSFWAHLNVKFCTLYSDIIMFGGGGGRSRWNKHALNFGLVMCVWGGGRSRGCNKHKNVLNFGLCLKKFKTLKLINTLTTRIQYFYLCC